ncbi:MAG: hypothetical protein A2428_08970 [Bdellovibrionales bacterium RIFOXYC1_FULL_54_43]|nr:MAG: hypothetical protein A2428_08970 [Bdellovibrionales bacterium RIFOXYC1_FULL_54_43]OFZ79601.1 MAG: hypothetical protein A2603_00610 [Bdellovibrionales bacterium RIFOXYD1_FULL_55_31]
MKAIEGKRMESANLKILIASPEIWGLLVAAAFSWMLLQNPGMAIPRPDLQALASSRSEQSATIPAAEAAPFGAALAVELSFAVSP